VDAALSTAKVVKGDLTKAADVSAAVQPGYDAVLSGVGAPWEAKGPEAEIRAVSLKHITDVPHLSAALRSPN
jgi:hypothetical protein